DVTLHVLDLIETSAKRGKEIVNQVLAFGRGVAGQRIPLQPYHILKEVLVIARETFPKTIDILDKTPRDLGGVFADPTQVQQALLNICVNARDAMPNGGQLTISGENITLDENYAHMNIDAQPGSYVAVSISDTGSGIPAQIRERIFEPFFTTKEIGKGTGLGLSTTLAIVKSHKGFITVDSELGKGTMIKVFLPLHREGQAAQLGEPRATIPCGDGETILVIDDEEGIRQITKETLEAFGYNAIAAKHGAEGVALFAENRAIIKAVLTDIFMPVMDGYATIRALRTLSPNVAIIATSGLSDGVRQMATSDVGAQAFLMKPYTAEKLLTTLHPLLNGASKVQKNQVPDSP
ncbi:MAG TPA: ATP-binding protein, partial [Bacteroidota bacterium]|nr:ATP-binding protein [Bacteroidota bacterium]